MKKIFSLLLICSLVYQSKLVIAQDASYEKKITISPEAEPSDSDIGKAISPMKKGQRAPFTGVLFSPAAAADVIVGISTFEEKIRIEVNNTIKKEQIECEKKTSDIKTRFGADKSTLQAQIDSSFQKINALNSKIKELEEREATKIHPAIWTSVGAASGIALTILTTYVVVQTIK